MSGNLSIPTISLSAGFGHRFSLLESLPSLSTLPSLPQLPFLPLLPIASSMMNATLPFSLPPLPLPSLLLDPQLEAVKPYFPLLAVFLLGIGATLFWKWLTGPSYVSKKRDGKYFDRKGNKVPSEARKIDGGHQTREPHLNNNANLTCQPLQNPSLFT